MRTIHGAIKCIHAKCWGVVDDNIVWIKDDTHQ